MITKTDLMVAKTVILQNVKLLINRTFYVWILSEKVFHNVLSNIETGFEVGFYWTEVLGRGRMLIKNAY